MNFYVLHVLELKTSKKIPSVYLSVRQAVFKICQDAQ